VLHANIKRLSRAVPYLRRIQDGTAAMRRHIAALEAENAVLRRQQRELLEEHRRASRLPLGHNEPSQFLMSHFIDRTWTDGGGVFVGGWVHAGPHRVTAVRLVCGDLGAETTEFTPRPDVAAHYDDLPPDMGAAGFSLYLACPPHMPLGLVVTTALGTARTLIDMPMTTDLGAPDATATSERFVASMLGRGGTVMEVGARIVGSMTQGWRARLEPGCRYLGNDIHPGPGIDVVGDVHSLGLHVAPGSLDGLFSVAVLEHLAAPWIAAAEISRALTVGGETLHVTHQTWPLHETPNDFFRMSDQALRSLFSPDLGFEVIACGMAYPVTIIPPTYIRHAGWMLMPFGRGYGQSYIHARKVAEAAPGAAGWDGAALQAVSGLYPLPAG
jgi:hypothetical protein